MWPARLGGWRVTTDGRRATTLHLGQTQGTQCRAGIQVGGLPFTWALNLPGHAIVLLIYVIKTM